MSSFFEIAQILYYNIYFNENTTYIRRNFFCVLLRIFFFTVRIYYIIQREFFI